MNAPVFTGERYVPVNAPVGISLEHMSRYAFAMSLCQDKRVLDAACGYGYGTYHLATCCKNAVGIDIAEEAIRYAVETYTRDNLTYVQETIQKLPFEDAAFDVVVSFETLEHVDADDQQKFLQEVRRVLTTDGLLIISTPDKQTYSTATGFNNTWHKHELTRQEFKDLLVRYFTDVSMLQQTTAASSVISGDRMGSLYTVGIHSGEGHTMLTKPAVPRYLVAVCSNKPVPTVPAVIATAT